MEISGSRNANVRPTLRCFEDRQILRCPSFRVRRVLIASLVIMQQGQGSMRVLRYVLFAVYYASNTLMPDSA
jgi:hypothetical protein